jgi:hypothetical protein
MDGEILGENKNPIIGLATALAFPVPVFIRCEKCGKMLFNTLERPLLLES